MTLAILATGDEIVHGDTLNTNGYEIAKVVSSEGIPLGLHLTCSDKEQELLECIDFLTKHHSIILSIGGLGPTTDDRTRFAFSKYLGLDLVEHAVAIDHIKARLKRANLPLDTGNLLQALFPPNVTLLPNPNGTAMGCMFEARDKLFILLPGPPRECLPMFNDHVLPRLQQTHHSQKKIISWQLFGVAEGQIGGLLEKALEGVPCNTGYRLDTPYLEFKVRCDDEIVSVVEQRINPLVTPYIISPPKQKASSLLRKRLIERIDPSVNDDMSECVVINDRATGGVLETLLRCPENQANLFFYHKEINGLHFDISGLDVFWQSDKTATTAEVMIKYHGLGVSGFERHTLPYRGHAMVLHYAAEWLSFRMLHLIDKIHQSIR